MGGTAVFLGTRVPIQSLFDYLEAGDSLEVFLDHFPTVSRNQVIGVLELFKVDLLAEYEIAALRVCAETASEGIFWTRC